jgi:hypothetical protein
MLALLKGGIYELRRFDWPRCHDIHTEFHKDWVRHSKGNGEGCMYGHAGTQTGR